MGTEYTVYFMNVNPNEHPYSHTNVLGMFYIGKDYDLAIKLQEIIPCTAPRYMKFTGFLEDRRNTIILDKDCYEELIDSEPRSNSAVIVYMLSNLMERLPEKEPLLVVLSADQ
jgi:hypothetical protein